MREEDRDAAVTGVTGVTGGAALSCRAPCETAAPSGLVRGARAPDGDGDGPTDDEKQLALAKFAAFYDLKPPNSPTPMLLMMF